MSRPDIVVIVADDLGYSDLGCFGGEIDTPHLDSLADDGLRMTSFYVTPRCSPSRAALLTGRDPHAVGVGVLTSDDLPYGYPGTLDTGVPTLGERLGAQGYRTALIGKWHLSSNTVTPNPTWPTRRGFPEFYGILPGCSSYYQPPLVDGESLVPERHASLDYYITDDLTDRACSFLADAAADPSPFLLYLAFTAPHWPLHARDADIAKYRERYRAGWDVVRRARYDRQQELGVATVAELPQRDPDVTAWDETDDQEWHVERMATYAAQVESLDRGVGRILEELGRSGRRENTLVVFLSDNGGCAEELPYRDGEPPFREDICPRLTRDGAPVAVGNSPAVTPGPESTYSSYGIGWANVSNTPFRLYKRWVHEGGISSPLIASWPRRIPAGVAKNPGYIVDLAATILDACDAPADLEGAGHTMASEWWQDLADPSERIYCWEHIGNAACRRGRWKAVREWGRDWELYDVEADRAESHDLAGDHPEVVADLVTQWQRWAETSGVIAWDELLKAYRARGRSEREALG